MAISLKVKGKIENGQLILDQNTAPFPWDGEVEVQVTLQETNLSNPEKQLEFEKARQDMQQAFKDAGIETREQVLELIQDVKREMAIERFGEL
ncbi:hypothetical protein K4A83_08415 [Spirulina subsalsa FACHB-351]|uniref:Uncharacterized protein n=1 Tax=Spirulina subsalsa FACHB-351 TaxID=234711 RepID=A0ABT3L5C2_9CYAN|nr:hypothetical protein [Spirulina subsalsa]MCW6036294.1 hypothetical protein [Spirulina subsalsa FACHB-351]